MRGGGFGLTCAAPRWCCGTRNHGPPAGCRTSDRGRRTRRGAAAPALCATSAGGSCPPPTRRSRWPSTRGSAAQWAAARDLWACGDEFDVVPAMNRYLEHLAVDGVGRGGRGSSAPGAAPGSEGLAAGWPMVAGRGRGRNPAGRDPGPARGAGATPQSSCTSNFKLDKLGTDGAGPHGAARWEQRARGAAVRPGLVLAIHAAGLPQPRRPGSRLPGRTSGCRHRTGHGGSASWALCLIGAWFLVGWEKAIGGDDEELAWWETNPYGRRTY